MISTDEWQEIIGTVGVLLLVTTVIVVLAWQFGATWRAKALLAREEEYKTIANKAVLLHESTERQLTEINGHLAEMQSRLQSVERILKDVE